MSRRRKRKQRKAKRSSAEFVDRMIERCLKEDGDSKENIIKLLRECPHDVPPWILYELRSLSIDLNSEPTAETIRQADKLFEKKIKRASIFRSHKIDDKRKYWHKVFHTAKQAMHGDSTIAIVRNERHPEFSNIRLQVIECAIEKKLLWERRSKPGSPKMSRAVPTTTLRRYAESDPWVFDPNTEKKYVYLRKRDDKTDIPFDLDAMPRGHVARMAQERLELINDMNNQYKIKYCPYSTYDKMFIGRRQIRPIHYAIFTERWDWHGRLYTGKYGHQSLSKLERHTIEFTGCESVERDYEAHHTRILYHLLDIDYRDDPYKLWGKKTTNEQRVLAKTVINAAINAKTRKDTISACNNAMRTCTNEKMKDAKGHIITDKKGRPRYERKTGKALIDAVYLYDAKNKVGISFEQIYDLALRRHKLISRYFRSDAGMWLMRIDSSIAIDIMYEFAKEAIPCLCCHDSFVVPAHHEQLLVELMTKWYFLRFGYNPVIKDRE